MGTDIRQTERSELTAGKRRNNGQCPYSFKTNQVLFVICRHEESKFLMPCLFRIIKDERAPLSCRRNDKSLN